MQFFYLFLTNDQLEIGCAEEIGVVKGVKLWLNRKKCGFHI